MKTITIALQKGGTGKTSLAVSLATELARIGRTLLIDADPQGNASTWIGASKVQYELADVLNSAVPIQKAINTTCIDNLYIVPTAGLGGNLRTYQQNKASGSPYAIVDALEPIAEHFSYCIIDTSPAFDPLNESVFMASDEIIPTLQFNEFSKDGFKIFLTNLQDARKRLHIPKEKAVMNKIILNSRDERIKIQSGILSNFQEVEKAGYELHMIPIDQSFGKAQIMHIAIQDLRGTKKETLQAIEKLSKAVM